MSLAHSFAKTRAHGTTASPCTSSRRVARGAQSLVRASQGSSREVGTERGQLSTRRETLLAVSSLLGLSVGSARSARAGEVLDGLIKYRDDAKAAFDADPSDEVLKGQLNFFEKQVEKTRANAEFLSDLRGKVESGELNYAGGLRFAVADVDAEVDFWTKALGMRVAADAGSGESRTVTLAYGQTSLSVDDGGKAEVVITQALPGVNPEVGNVLSYVAVTVPFGLRVSQIYDSGGELLYGFGFFDMRSPNGIPVRGQVATRRDPLEVIALNVKSVREAEKFLVAEFGFTSRKPLDDNSYAPKSPPGSRLLYFGNDPKKTLGIILQPSRERNLQTGRVLDGISIARAGEAASASTFADARVANVPFLLRPLADFK
jgi:catechol 2,3-dioxygenase-like lactoylglutathione lyase family enzyme